LISASAQNSPSSSPPARSQTVMVLSCESVTMRVPSGENAQTWTFDPAGVGHRFVSYPVATSQMASVPSEQHTRSARPSGENAQSLTAVIVLEFANQFAPIVDTPRSQRHVTRASWTAWGRVRCPALFPDGAPV
jgi:hypothetical protein